MEKLGEKGFFEGFKVKNWGGVVLFEEVFWIEEVLDVMRIELKTFKEETIHEVSFSNGAFTIKVKWRISLELLLMSIITASGPR